MKDIVKVRIQGSSITITIPKELAADLGWNEGDRVLLESTLREPPNYLTGIAVGPKILKIAKIE